MSERRDDAPRSTLKVLDDEPDLSAAPACFPAESRREAVRKIGGWLIFAGVLGASGCGSPQNTKTSPTCDCSNVSGTNTGLKKTDIPQNGVAWNSGASMFIAHDANGFYAMDSICTHQGCDIGAQGGFTGSNLAQGFFCNCHGSSFDANGNPTGGPAQSPLSHYKLSIDASGSIFLDTGTVLSDPTCRCT